MSLSEETTICAISTPPGRGSVGIIRVSGPKTSAISFKILGFKPEIRYAHTCKFLNHDQSVLDVGIAIFFEAPNSYTGEDTLELQCHGSLPLLSEILNRLLSLGAVIARPGEFTERSFLNGKMDLTQAEAVADLIEAGTVQQAKSASRTLRGAFSTRIRTLQEQLTKTRINVEAAIDFSDEDLDLDSNETILNLITKCLTDLTVVFREAKQGVLIKEGIQVVIAGYPNSGKSTLLNAISGEDTAIVTEVPGTTRDILNVEVSVKGIPINLQDTAGLRETEDPVEREGVRRAQDAILVADHILLVIDITTLGSEPYNLLDVIKSFSSNFSLNLNSGKHLTIVINKLDLIDNCENFIKKLQAVDTGTPIIGVSAKTGEGLENLRENFLKVSGHLHFSESDFSARTRHISALEMAQTHLVNAQKLAMESIDLELIAEELRLSQLMMGSITGELTSDDLLGEIFASFCIGK